MPAPKSVCWCFGGRPPEITIDGDTPLKAMEVEIPMPTDEKEIDEKFAEIVVIEFPPLSRLMRRHNAEVPINTCNMMN